MANNNSNKKSTNGGTKSSVQPRSSKKNVIRRNNSNGMGSNNVGALTARPAAYSRPVKSSAPIQMMRGGTRVLKFKEFVQDIPGSVAFSANSFVVNPGIPTLFAWLSGQALFYQEYQFKYLRFCYETEKSTATSGKVMFAFQPDSADPLPASKQEMLENQFKSGGAPWEPFGLNVGQQVAFALGKRRYIRGGTLAANLDQKTYDIGQLIVATQGMADTTNVGELYVEYEVDLLTPIQSAQQFASALSKLLSSTTSTSASLFGAAATVGGGSLDVTGAVNTLTFNRVGRYFVFLTVVGTGLFTVFNPVTTGTTATIAVVTGLSNAAANIGTVAIISYTVIVLVRGQILVMDCSTQATTITSASCYIAGYSA